MAKLENRKTKEILEINGEIPKEVRIKQFRAEASRKASLANKRIKRLEKAGLEESPAYKRWLRDGGEKFSVKGKTYREVQSEVKRLNRFIDAQTSTVRGTNKVLKEMAENTGIKYKNLTELKQKSAKFFELASKTEQYLRNIHDAGSAIGYQKIWEQINTYLKVANADLSDGKLNLDQMIEAVSNALLQYEDPMKMTVNVTGETSEWFLLQD